MRYGFTDRLVFITLAIVGLTWSSFSYAGQPQNRSKMASVYSDESHCLDTNEIRGEKDNPISCSCRDALWDAYYVSKNYLLSGKDKNLYGVYYDLVGRAQQICGEAFVDVIKATMPINAWHWNGPQVTRRYIPKKEVCKIQPDGNGNRSVEYIVRLTYTDAEGHITKIESYSVPEILPANYCK